MCIKYTVTKTKFKKYTILIITSLTLKTLPSGHAVQSYRTVDEPQLMV